ANFAFASSLSLQQRNEIMKKFLSLVKSASLLLYAVASLTCGDLFRSRQDFRPALAVIETSG
ncbi:hypothetical protein, partial [Achromobacter mucicolens]|uniref:hypothetical protein n=1 Tax=Achromobacter mucicolens TaxID=1389922 RepID=UPI0039F02775